MGLFDFIKGQLLEVIEWTDEKELRKKFEKQGVNW